MSTVKLSANKDILTKKNKLLQQNQMPRLYCVPCQFYRCYHENI